MKRHIAILFIILFPLVVIAQNQKPFEVFQENNLFGLRDLNKQVVIKPIYKNIKISKFGSFAMQNNQFNWALFDTDGIRVTDFQFDNMEQNLPGIVEMRKGGLIGLFDENGKELIPVKYNKITAVGKVILSEIGKEHNNMKPKGFLFRGAIVTKGNLSGFINTAGQEILKINYQRIQPTADFRLDLGFVDVVGLIIKKDNQYGIVDETGAEIIPMEYLYINAINQLGFGEIQQNGKKGLYNSAFKIITEPQFDNITVLNETLFAGEKNGLWSIYTSKTPEKPTLTCDAVKSLTNNFAKVTSKNKAGAIDENGKLIIPFEYDNIIPFGRNLLLKKKGEHFVYTADKQIKKWIFPNIITWYNLTETLKPIRFDNGKIGFINDNAVVIIPPNYDKATGFKDGIAIVCNNGKCGFIKPNQTFILPIEYELPTLDLQPNALLAKRDGKYGYLGYQGQVIIPLNYEEISAFKPIMKAKKNGKYGFINQKEAIIIPLKYDFIESYEATKSEFRFISNGKTGWANLNGVERFSIGLSAWADKIYALENGVQNVKISNNYGLLDEDENWISPMTFQKYISFDENEKAIVRTNNKWGMIDKKGKIIIPFEFDERLKFNAKGLACIRKNGKFGIIQNDGKIIVPPIYDSYIYSDYEFWTVQKDGKQGIINQEGKVLITPIYDKVFPYINGMALVKKEGKWGYINEQNKVIIPFEYDVLNSFNQGKALASKAEKWGIIDLGNNIILPFEYDNLIAESANYTNASKNGLWGILDNNYTTIIPHKYDRIDKIKTFFKVEKNKKIGVFTDKGQLILPTYYDALTIEEKIGFKVKKDGKFGLISTKGKVIVPVIYNEMSFFVEGFSRVKKDGKFGMILKNGELIIPCKYDNLGSHFHGKYVEAKQGDNWGILDQFGKKALKFKYENIRFISDNEIEGFIDGNWKKIQL